VSLVAVPVYGTYEPIPGVYSTGRVILTATTEFTDGSTIVSPSEEIVFPLVGGSVISGAMVWATDFTSADVPVDPTGVLVAYKVQEQLDGIDQAPYWISVPASAAGSGVNLASATRVPPPGTVVSANGLSLVTSMLETVLEAYVDSLIISLAEPAHIYNVLGYGIANNGTNVTTALGVLIDIAEVAAQARGPYARSTIYFPDGRYGVTHDLVFPDRVGAEGESREGTEIVNLSTTAGTNGLVFRGSGIGCRRLTYNGQHANQVGSDTSGATIAFQKDAGYGGNLGGMQLSASVTATATSFSVVSSTFGLSQALPGDMVSFYDGTNYEVVQIAESYTPGSGSVAISGQFAHSYATSANVCVFSTNPVLDDVLVKAIGFVGIDAPHSYGFSCTNYEVRDSTDTGAGISSGGSQDFLFWNGRIAAKSHYCLFVDGATSSVYGPTAKFKIADHFLKALPGGTFYETIGVCSGGETIDGEVCGNHCDISEAGDGGISERWVTSADQSARIDTHGNHIYCGNRAGTSAYVKYGPGSGDTTTYDLSRFHHNFVYEPAIAVQLGDALVASVDGNTIVMGSNGTAAIEVVTNNTATQTITTGLNVISMSSGSTVAFSSVGNSPTESPTWTSVGDIFLGTYYLINGLQSGWTYSTGTGGGSSIFPGYYNVITYGADPTGTSDSSVAFNAAIAAAHTNSGTVYIPPGAYKVGGTALTNITKAAVNIKGAGSAASFLLYTGSGDCLRVQMASFVASQQCGVIEGITIDGTLAAGTSACGLHYGDAMNGCFRDLVVQNFTGTSAIGIHMDNVNDYTEGTCWDRVYVANCTTDVLFDINGGGSPSGVDNSFGYQRIRQLRLLCNSGQVGFAQRNGALIYNHEFGVTGNFHSGSTVMTIAGITGVGTTGMAHGAYSFQVEVTGGGTATGISLSQFAQMTGAGTVDLESGSMASAVGGSNPGQFDLSGWVFLGTAALGYTNTLTGVTATSATGGSASALPVLPVGYREEFQNGAIIKVAYYAI
jgi:pectate lyase-like protein